ncbi:hypothetical protein GCM10025865_12170 [Paraoerskovia sediminicola]|uniref:Ribonuclease H n=1 Tax=Paraoerskovia sediminicola TaxID=1138587 RepID=A0ABN6XEM4_9CELL|nr:ribonuclease H [Paraoerskovia sediminicola]BDZ41918.1 hypothetical protein GCM10025865_12170 [Paraoerskovia sediminicola]
MNESARTVVATDGACIGNPGPAGWGWVRADGVWRAGAFARATNNIAELTAVLDALLSHADVADLELRVDSQYVINAYTKWMDGWKRKGWVNASKKPVANREIIEQLIAVRDARTAAGLPPAMLTWVRGHAGDRLNGWADNRATDAAAQAKHRDGEEWGSDDEGPLDVSVDAPTAGEDKPVRSRAGDGRTGGGGSGGGRSGGGASGSGGSAGGTSSGGAGSGTGGSGGARPKGGPFGNQSDLGARIGGLSAVEVGKLLETAGLRDPSTRMPTDTAIESGLAKVSTLRDGTKYGRWHTEKVAALLR